MRTKWAVGLILCVTLLLGTASAQEPKPLTLEEAIKTAVEKNYRLIINQEGVVASENRKMYALTQFFPTWTGQYNYTYFDAPTNFVTSAGTPSRTGATSTRDLFAFSTTASQPVFTGGAVTANYRSESIGVDISKTNVETARRDLIFQVRQSYFNILTAQKAVDVSEQAVKQFQAQLQVTQAFFDVGIVAKNDVLQAEVRLAQAVQNEVNAVNLLELSKSSFNNLLQRDVNAPVILVDILAYTPANIKFEESLTEALRQRPEIRAANLTVDQAREAVNIARSGYFPTITIAGNYNKASDSRPLLDEHWTEHWQVQALASIAFTDFWRLRYRVGESRVRVAQAQSQRNQVVDNVLLEVKQNYINMVQAEKNITVAQKAIEQAEENVRLNEERYRYQVATATELLDAVTLLAQARLNYYSALSTYNIAKAALERAMGRVYP